MDENPSLKMSVSSQFNLKLIDIVLFSGLIFMCFIKSTLWSHLLIRLTVSIHFVFSLAYRFRHLANSMASLPVLPALCLMFSYFLTSFGNNVTCSTCSLFALPVASQAPVTVVAKYWLATICSPPADFPKHPGKWNGWGTLRKKCTPKQKPPV